MSLLNPRQRFLTSGHAAKHQEWSRSEAGKAACEAVLADMAMTESDLSRLAGARSFVELLLKIAEVPLKKPEMPSSTLKYDQPQPTIQNAH